jgi:hypothetical protein
MQRDDVLLAGRGDQQDPMLAAGLRNALRLALEREHADRDLGGDVLVGDRDLAALPEVADAPHRWGDDLVVDARRVQSRVHRLAGWRSRLPPRPRREALRRRRAPAR